MQNFLYIYFTGVGVKAYFIPLAITVVLFSCKAKPKPVQADEETVPVRVLALAPGSSSRFIHTSGTFTTDDETILSFKNGGIIDRIYVREGDAVTKGQLLATVKNTEANAGTQQALLAYEKADRDYRRAQALYNDSVATLEQLQNAKTAADIARQQVAFSRFNQDASGIRATVSGYVLQRLAVEGQTAGPGTPVFRINGARQGSWFLKAGVSEKELGMITAGDSADLYPDAFPGAVLHGVVDKKSMGIDPASGTFDVYIKITADAPHSLAAGMFAKAVIKPAMHGTSWKISYNALLDGQEGRGYVFITNDGKTAQKVPVTISSIDKDGVSVSAGLENAKFLIWSGSAYLDDGSKISIINTSAQ